MKLLIIVVFAITFVKYSRCVEVTLSSEDQHDYDCKISIETTYQESCTILMRPNRMGPAMLGLRAGNDSKAIEFCRLVPEGANCVLNNFATKVTDDCKSVELYETKIVLAKHDKTYSEYFCANNMQHLRDRSELDGIDCLYVNEFYNCKHRTHKTRSVRLTKKEELCRDNYLNRECSVHWGACENRKVRDVQFQLFDVMLQGMDCPP